MVSRLGQAVTGLVEAAVPGSLMHLLVFHWFIVLYLFELLAVVGGAVFGSRAIAQFGTTALLITTAINIVIWLIARAILVDIVGSRRSSCWALSCSGAGDRNGPSGVCWPSTSRPATRLDTVRRSELDRLDRPTVSRAYIGGSEALRERWLLDAVQMRDAMPGLLADLRIDLSRLVQLLP